MRSAGKVLQFAFSARPGAKDETAVRDRVVISVPQVLHMLTIGSRWGQTE